MNKDFISYEGQTVSELKQDFEGAIDYYLASCKDRGVLPKKPYGGNQVLLMTPELHSKVAAVAESTGTTINSFINRAITNELKHDNAL
jgi:predicted HicB family RNase H-like nuclease